MAGEIASAYVRLRSDSTGFQSEVERGVKAGFVNVRNIIGGAFAAAGVFEGAKAIIESAANHQAAFAIVDQTLKNANQATTLYGHSVESLIEKEARLKGFHDEDLASSFVRLVSATHNSAEAFKDLGLAEDVARARHIAVTVAALALSRAEQGSTQSLSRLGVVIHANNAEVAALKQRHDEAVASGAKFTAAQNLIYKAALQEAAAHDKVIGRLQAVQLVRQRFGGEASKFAQTAAGQFQQTQQDIHQFEVSVGEHALPVVNQLAEGIGKYAVELTHSQGVQDAVGAGLRDIATAGKDVKGIIEAVGPEFLAVADAALKTAGAIGAPALLTAAATYKGISIAVGIAGAAEAAYQRVILTGTAVKQAETTETAALTAALTANTEAMAANRAAALSGVAANAELGASQVALAGESDAAATGGLATFARGIGQLGLASAGGVTGLAVLGLAAVAGGIAYLATRETDTQRATDNLRSAFDLLAGSLNKTRELANEVAQSKIDVALAKDSKAAADAAVQQAAATERATRNTKDHAAAVLALRTARDQDKAAALAVTQAEDRRSQASNSQIANEKAIRVERTNSLQTALAKAETLRSRDLTEANRTVGRFGQLGDEAVRTRASRAAVLDAASAADFIKVISGEAGKLQSKNPGLATSLRLLEQFARDIGTLPSQKEIRFILDPGNARKSLNVIEAELLRGTAAAAATARRGGHQIGQALADGIPEGVAQATPDVFSAVHSLVQGVIGSGKAAAEARSPSQRTAREIGLPLAQGVVLGINTGSASVQSALKDLVGQAVTQGAQQITDSINQAKQNLNSIGGTIASDIGQILNQPIAAAQARFSAEQNRLTLDNLKRSVILPGGRTLSANDAIAARQLHALENRPGANRAALQAFSLQFDQARLAVQQDQATARANAASRGIADITDEFNRGAITGAQVTRRINTILARDGITYKRTGSLLGVAFADGFQAQLIGLREQIRAEVGVPRIPGSGLIPSIVRPLDTIKQVTQQVAQAAHDQRAQQIAEAKAQTAEAKRHTKLLEKIAAKDAAAAFIASLPKGEQARVSKALAGTTG